MARSASSVMTSTITAFGSAGSGNGQFSGPAGIALDPVTGNVHVADSKNNRVETFDSSGTYLGQFGGSGTGDGQFSNPQGVAVDPNTGDLYVVDSDNCRVEKFTSAGAYVSQFGTCGTGVGQFTAPTGVAVDPGTGLVYVADHPNPTNRVSPTFVEKFDSAGHYLGKIGPFGMDQPKTQLPLGPTAVGVDPTTGDIWIGSENFYWSTLAEYDPSGAKMQAAYVDVKDSGGTLVGFLCVLAGIAVDATSGDVYVSNSNNNGSYTCSGPLESNKVWDLDSSAKYRSYFGTDGSGLGQFDNPGGVAIDPTNGAVFVVDSGNNRVEKFSGPKIDVRVALQHLLELITRPRPPDPVEKPTDVMASTIGQAISQFREGKKSHVSATLGLLISEAKGVRQKASRSRDRTALIPASNNTTASGKHLSVGMATMIIDAATRIKAGIDNRNTH
jgi:DNA-binding beta-propeller fold protein YncE